MNVNGARFDLLLGRADWGRCLDGDERDARPLAAWWSEAWSPAGIPAWDDARDELHLQEVALELPPTPGEAALTIEGRRSAAADAHGNVYRIGDDRRSLRVFSAGSRRETAFWPAGPVDCEPGHESPRSDFRPLQPASPGPDETYLTLAVTVDAYLVVAFTRGTAHGLLSFDLLAGGPPVITSWPGASFAAFDMAPRAGGGVWLLERRTGSSPAQHVLWELDCRLAVVAAAQPVRTLAEAELADFQPVSGPPRGKPPVTFPGGFDLGAAPFDMQDPVAVEAGEGGAVFVLDREAGGPRARVARLQRDGETWRVDLSAWLDELPDAAHDFVYARGRAYREPAAARQFFIATAGGNQARAYAVVDGGGLELRASTHLFPLRRFGGRALLTIGGHAHYDSGIEAPVWTPIVQQPRASFRAEGALVTPVFDSGELGTTWDRVLLDACVPPGTRVEIWSRAGDETTSAAEEVSPAFARQVVGTWMPEPALHLRDRGPELPWLRGEAVRETRREAGTGTWELLLQRAHGRFLQLRLVLRSAHRANAPRVRALRVWSPRFSYPERFLPAVYREDAAAGPFLERWLANFESTLTHIEDHVASLQALFDPRVVPADALAWLAGWFDVAVDPGWDERRRRLFVRHAMDFFRWRGTTYGLRLALELAFDGCFDPALFGGPDALVERPQRIRIVEAHRARVTEALVAAHAETTVGVREVRRAPLWTPQEGNAGLRDRFAEWSGRRATAAERVAPFALVPPAGEDGDPNVEAWRAFAQSHLGFVPGVGAAERRRWQRFLAARYATPAALSTAHRAAYSAFEEVALPRDWPAPEVPAAAADWEEFLVEPYGAVVRARWHDFLARKYRRIERLNRAHATRWPALDKVALPDVLPGAAAAQGDWLQFERVAMAMHRTAHRFSVLLPVSGVVGDPSEMERRASLARRIVDLEKPAHTVYDVRFYWALFRVGEARMELDTLLGQGSRAPELIPPAVLGQTYMGASFVGGTARPRDGDRRSIEC